MPISNGIDTSVLLPILSARRGFKQPTSADFTPVLNTAATTNLSGRYYNLEHTACDPISIWKSQPDIDITDGNFNTYLADLKNQVAMEALQRVFIADALVEMPQITYEKSYRSGYITIPNTGKFVGTQLKLADGNYAIKIDSLMLTMTKACNVTMYVYKDVKEAPLWQHTFSVTDGYDQNVYNLNTNEYTEIILRRNDRNSKGGLVWFGYYQQELEDQGANAADIYLGTFGNYCLVGYQSFEAAANYGDKTFLKDRYMSNYRTYGVNVEMSGWNDYTNLVAAQPQMFDNLLGYLMAQKCMDFVVNSNRSNRDIRLSDENYADVFNAIENVTATGKEQQQLNPYKTGFKAKIENEVKRLQATFYDDAQVISGIPPVNRGDYSQYYSIPFGRII